MASTFDNDLRLEEMATGENAGSWGTKTNTNLELIADAFGYGTFTIADADTTLTMPDGSDTDNALRSLYLKISSSADLTTTRTLTLAPNSVSKLWYIENNTSGGQTITISQGSGANVSILNGQAKLVATDGAGAGAAVIDATQDLAIPDLFIDDDLSLQSDGAIINFGADADVNLTHVADTGLRLNAAMALEFRDGDLSINSSADGQLDIDADTKVSIANSGTEIFSVDTSGVNVNTISALDGTEAINIADSTGEISTSGVDVRIEGVTNTNLFLSDASQDQISMGADARYGSSRLTVHGGSNAVLALARSNVSGGTPTGNTGLWLGDAGSGTVFFARDKTSNNTADAVIYGEFGYNTQDERMRLSRSYSTILVDGGEQAFKFSGSANVSNEEGRDIDFRVESDGSTHALFVDAGNNRVGVLASAPRVPLEVGSFGTAVGMSETQIALAGFTGSFAAGLTFFDDNGEANAQQFYFDPATCTLKLLTTTNGGTNKYNRMEIQGNAAGGEVSFNQDGQNHDFRVESDNQTHALFVDASSDRVGISDSAPTNALSVAWSAAGHGTGLDLRNEQLGGYGGSLSWYSTRSDDSSQALAAQIMTFGEESWSSAATQSSILRFRVTKDSNFYEQLRLSGTNVVINEDARDTDFRVESDNNANMIRVDASEDAVGIGVAPASSYRTLTVSDGSTEGAIHINGENAGLYLGTSFTGGFTNNAAIARARSAGFHIANSQVGDLCIAPERQSDILFGGVDSASGSNNDYVRLEAGGTFNVYRHAIFNENSGDYDFRVESNGNANMLTVDAGYDQVLFGTTTTRANSSGLQKPHIVSGSSVAGQSIDGGATFNTAAYQFGNSLNTTKTIQIYPGSGVYGLLEVHVSGYNSSGSGATHACFHAGGHTGNATLYNIQELYRYNHGNLTTSAATITGGRLQFTVATSGTGTTGLTTFTVKSMDSGAVIPRIVVT